MKSNTHIDLINERYPDIGKRISIVWGDASLRTYLLSLISDTRDGTRQGFPKDVVTALLALSHIHDEEFPEYVPKTTGVWAVDSRWGTL